LSIEDKFGSSLTLMPQEGRSFLRIACSIIDRLGRGPLAFVNRRSLGMEDQHGKAPVRRGGSGQPAAMCSSYQATGLRLFALDQ